MTRINQALGLFKILVLDEVDTLLDKAAGRAVSRITLVYPCTCQYPSSSTSGSVPHRALWGCG